MNNQRTSGSGIARLLDAKGSFVGWVILWDNAELSILRDDGMPEPKFLVPPLPPETLAGAKAVTTDDVTELLEMLSSQKANPAS